VNVFEQRGCAASPLMLIVSDAAAAVSWYTKALGAGQLWDLDGVAGLHLDGTPFFVHEAVPFELGH
jgi:PhnB protein